MSVMIVMGSKSDKSVADKVVGILKELDIDYKITVASAHRTPEIVTKIAKEDVKVFIAIAGLSAALPGALASHTIKPVIGVPVSGKINLDSILSIVQMPPGIPVAGVGLDNGKNAGLLAAQILALEDKNIEKKIIKYREKMKEKVNIDAKSIIE